jgi:outer membrane protein assembly factor BamD (BamD/ComL family)
LRSPFFRVGIAAAIILMIFSLPAREFLKLTFLLGMPFMVFLHFAVHKPKFSLMRIISIIALVGITGGYVYMLTDLPERIETNRIISEGSTLVAEGKYEEAISRYQELEKLGRSEKMHKKIAEARREETASNSLVEAKKLLQEGNQAAAIKKLKSIPDNTRAAREAQHILKDLRE